MKIQRLLLGAIASLSLMMCTACIVAGTETSGTGLYAFDESSSKILAWDDLETLYTSGSTSSVTTAPTPDRTLTSDYLADIDTLGLGGMCMDRTHGRLWLVSTTGLIARIDSIRSRSGALTSSYIRTFQLDSDDFLDDSTFGQMAVDSSGNLYITEWNSSNSRIWVISSPTSYAQDDTVSSSSATLLTTSKDYNGYGVAVTSSRVYAYFNSGKTLSDDSDNSYSGARLRLGTSSAFSKVIIGSETEFASYGILAADSTNGLIYAARSTNASNPVIAYKNSQFSDTYNNVAPSIQLPGNTANPIYVTVIAHPGNKDWLVGSGSTSSSSTSPTYLTLWKSPATDTSTEPVVFNYGYAMRGIALDGSASSE